MATGAVREFAVHQHGIQKIAARMGTGTVGLGF
jgi:hypothetical protein